MRIPRPHLPGPDHDPRVICPKCGKAVMLMTARAHMIGHEYEDLPAEAWEGPAVVGGNDGEPA